MKYYIFIIIVILILVQSCGKKSITRKYYVLDFPRDTDSLVINRPQIASSCEIRSVNMPPAYSQHRIAVRQRSHEISYYHYHYWAMEPGELITNLILKHIDESGIFAQVSRDFWQGIPQYLITTQVYHLEAEAIDDHLYARLKMRIELMDQINKKVLISHQFDRSEEEILFVEKIVNHIDLHPPIVNRHYQEY